MKTVLMTTAILALGAVSVPAMAQSNTQSWTGPYLGVYGSYLEPGQSDKEKLRFDRNLDGNFNEQVTTTTNANAFSPGSCSGEAKGPTAAQGCTSDKGGIEGGIRAGYDYQIGSFVVGGVAEIGGTEAKDTVTSFSTTPASYTFKRNLEYLAAARLRVGYAYGNGLIYATGGYAGGKMSNRFFTSNGTNTFTATQDEDKADGYQVGGGLEYRLTSNLSVTGEYLYTSLDAGDFTVRVGRGAAAATNPFILPPNTTGTDIRRSNDEFNIHAVRIGMNYRF